MMNHRLLWLPLSGLLLVLLPTAVPRVEGITARRRRSPVGKRAFRTRVFEVTAVKDISPIPGGPKAASKQAEISDFVRLSPKLHGASIAFFVAGVCLLRFEPFAKKALDLLSLVPCASWEPSNRFHSLSALDWVVHVIVKVFALELAGGFFSLMRNSGNDTRAKTMYKGYFAVYAASYAYTLFTMFSHAMIGANTKLEHVLGNWFTGVLQTASIFGSGLAVTAGPWALLPVFAGVNLGVIGFDNWLGRILATFSIYKYFVPEIPALFRYSFIGMSVVPGLMAQIMRQILKVGDPYTDYDANHILVASVLGLFSAAMAHSLNYKAKYGDE